MQFPPTVRAFGGEIRLGADALLEKPRNLSKDCLAFSHARAALIWLNSRAGPFDCVMLSAYTCPSVPRMYSNLGCSLIFVDLFSDRWEEMIRRATGRLLVLVPAFLGHDVGVDLLGISKSLENKGIVVVDAAQTAFGHETISVPESVAVLSCPRKCVAVGDGAILRWSELTDVDHAAVAKMPWATNAVAAKLAARALCAWRSPAVEPEMLRLNAEAELAWPDYPHRMSDSGTWFFSWTDPVAHARRRWENWATLSRGLAGRVEIVERYGGTPYNFSILVNQRDEILKRLHSQRVFATALWPDSVHSGNEHPVAADFTRRLIGLPIDQSYSVEDMDEILARVLGSLCQ